MTKSYFLRILALAPYILSNVSIILKATEYFNFRSYWVNTYSIEHRSRMPLSNCFDKINPYATDKKFSKQLFFNRNYQWLLILPCTKKEKGKDEPIVQYQSEGPIIFDAKNNILSLHGPSVLTYDKMKLKANVVALHLNTNMISAQGIKDLHNQSIGNPIFTYTDVTKNKYGKNGPIQTRIFFTKKIWYNIDTKRTLIDTLLTKHEDSIIKSKQVKKEDEETFYAEDIIYTTCALTNPHFYIRTKRAKIIHGQQVTTGPFQLYFDGVPTPLGCVFGAFFLDGKRKHGIIPPDIGEGENGFYLRNGGYYINFNDYADIFILGNIYSSGITELKNELRYKKRYLYSGNMHYAHNIIKKEQGWSFKWTHKTLAHGPRSLNTSIDLHNKSYKTLDHNDKKIPQSIEQQSSAILSYQDQLIGFPYGLTIRAEFKNNFLSNFKHWILPNGILSSSAWYPFKIIRSKGKNHWFHNIQLKHNINFENHFQNAKKDPNPLYNNQCASVPLTYQWNSYIENGIKHNIPLSMQCKVLEVFNLKPHLTYVEGWYWFKKDTKGPQAPGFNRVYTWHLGAELGTTLYHTYYFKDPTWIQGFRIKTEPSVDFDYTPDCSKKYFQEVENQNGNKEQKYVFEGLRPNIKLVNRATSILRCKLHNTVELKVKKEIFPEQKDKKQTSYKIFLLKNLDFETKYDFNAEKCHLIDGIQMHIASEAKMGEVGKMGFDLTTNFDPYLFKIVSDLNSDKIKQESINVFAWKHGQNLVSIRNATCKINIDFAHYSNKEKKQDLFSDHDPLTTKFEDNKIDFESPWNINWEFNWIYQKLYEYSKDQKDYNMEKYITFNGSITLVKKWKLNIYSTYNFNKSEFDPLTTRISIQRDLHCWQLSYQWHPLGNLVKYDFYLGAKANALKVLKLLRKRRYNKLN